MSLATFLYFLAASVTLIIIPGPNVLAITGTSLTHGPIRGIQTVAGTSLAMAIQLTVAVLATTGLIVLLARGFILVKWLGVIYLLYIGVKHLISAAKNTGSQLELSASGSFFRGFFVALTNPKTIVFFAAFLPQFVEPNQAILPQLLILSTTFLVVAAILDSCYVLLAGKLMPIVKRNYLQRFSNAVTGIIYLVAGLWLALVRRTA